MSASTSPSTTSTSPSLPDSSVPISLACPIISAPVLVAYRIVSSGVKPTYFTKNLQPLLAPRLGYHELPRKPTHWAERARPQLIIACCGLFFTLLFWGGAASDDTGGSSNNRKARFAGAIMGPIRETLEPAGMHHRFRHQGVLPDMDGSRTPCAQLVPLS